LYISFSAASQTVRHGRKAKKRVFEIEVPPKKKKKEKEK
jgi:hypothetical protein